MLFCQPPPENSLSQHNLAGNSVSYLLTVSEAVGATLRSNASSAWRFALDPDKATAFSTTASIPRSQIFQSSPLVRGRMSNSEGSVAHSRNR